MSDATTGSAQANARVSTIPKLSPPSDGAISAFVRESRLVSSSCGRKPRMSMPASEIRSRVSSSRTASGSEPQIWSRAPVRAWISGQARSSTWRPLRGLLASREGDRVLATRRVDVVRDEHAVRDDLVVAGKPARRRLARTLRDGDPLVDPAREESPGRDRRASSSRARPTRGASRRSAPSPGRAPRCTSRASSARAGGARRSAPARARA